MAEYEEFWINEHESLRSESKSLIVETPEAKDVIQRVLKTLSDIVSLASCTPAKVGQSEEWSQIVATAQEDREKLCAVLRGKRLFSALYGVYCLALANLKAVLQNSVGRTSEPFQTTEPTASADDTDGFQERKRKKRNITGETSPPKTQAATPVPTRNFFAPLNSMEMDTEGKTGDDTPKYSGRPPPIVVTTSINLIKTQKEIKPKLKGDFTLRNTKNGTRLTTKNMDDYSILKQYLEQNETPYYTFHPKGERPIKAVIRHLPGETPAEDIANELLALGYKVHNVRQMTTTRQQAEGGRQTQALPLFLVTLEREEKSQQIFKLTHLNHIIIQVEAYRARTGLTQCYNCQQFGHVWVNCKQPPRCLWCGGGHRHKECPEKDNESSSPSCCNCKLAEGEKPHPANYRGCKLAKEEMLRRRTPATLPKNTAGRTFSSKPVTPCTSYAAALMTNTQQRHQGQPTPPKEPAGEQRATQLTAQATRREAKAANTPTHTDTTVSDASHNTGQSVQANDVNSSLNDMFKVAAIVQQIMSELNGAVTEEQKIVAITRIVFNLLKTNGH
jgi:hypothetical protein